MTEQRTPPTEFIWSEDDNVAMLRQVGEQWEIAYGFEATAHRGRQFVVRHQVADYAEAVQQLWQVIGYYFAAPEHAERVRVELLRAAGLPLGESKYLPVPNATALTAAGGGVSGAEEAVAETARRARILSGEPAPTRSTLTPPPAEKPPWWKKLGRKREH